MFFFALRQNLGLSSEVSFGLSFVSGYALTYFLNRHFDDTVEQYGCQKHFTHGAEFRGKVKEEHLGKHHEKLLNNLAELRKSASLTQQELSERAEVSRKSINAIENGIYVPSTVLALKIARTLNCRVEDLFRLPS